MKTPKRHRQQIRALVSEWNEIVDQNERNSLRQEQIMRSLRLLGALDDTPIPYKLAPRALTSKPDGSLS